MSIDANKPGGPMSRLERLAEPAEHERMFPTDRPADRRVSRREFGRFFVVASGSMAAGQGWIALRSLGSGEADAVLPVQAVARVDEIPVGGAVAFRYPDPDGEPVLLVRLAERRFVAYVQRCTHLSCAVVWDEKSRCILCPCHAGCFEPTTGRATAGPPKRPLTAVRIEIRGGTLYAAGRMETA
jgi:Rieske Fe-S protein